jgi:hypothetical protein
MVASICRRLNYKDYYNTLPELYPEEIYKKYEYWKNIRPNWSVVKICFRIVFWEVMLAYFFSITMGALRMGCTYILVNLVAYVNGPYPSH